MKPGGLCSHISTFLPSFSPLPQDAGGMMTLTDAFCRLNRARGLELVSPDDLLNACAELNKGGAAASSLALHTFDGTGVMVLRYVGYLISCT